MPVVVVFAPFRVMGQFRGGGLFRVYLGFQRVVLGGQRGDRDVRIRFRAPQLQLFLVELPPLRDVIDDAGMVHRLWPGGNCVRRAMGGFFVLFLQRLNAIDDIAAGADQILFGIVYFVLRKFHVGLGLNQIGLQRILFGFGRSGHLVSKLLHTVLIGLQQVFCFLQTSFIFFGSRRERRRM